MGKMLDRATANPSTLNPQQRVARLMPDEIATVEQMWASVYKLIDDVIDLSFSHKSVYYSSMIDFITEMN
jgi:hypothetical protein